jgi:hypothetical protein
MSSFDNRFGETLANFLNENFIHPVAKYVTENIEKLKDMSEEDIVTSFREVLDLPQTTVSAVAAPKPRNNITSLLPDLPNNGLPGLGNMTAPPAALAKKKTATKEKPVQRWLSLTEVQPLFEQKAKICYYYASSRIKDENKKDKVCGAAIDEPELTTDPEAYTWRCANCTGKASDVRKQFNTGPVKGIDPTKSGVMLGVNIPPVLPGGTAPLPSLPVHPSALPPSASSIPTLGVTSPEKKPDSPLKVSTGSLPPLPSNISMPEPKPMSPAPKLSLAKHPGLKATHLKASNPDVLEIGVVFYFERNPQATVIKAIGKYPGLFDADATEGYDQKIQPLSDSEQKIVRRYGIQYEYTAPEPVVELNNISLPPGLGALPSVPGLPGLPSLPGLPGLPPGF